MKRFAPIDTIAEEKTRRKAIERESGGRWAPTAQVLAKDEVRAVADLDSFQSEALTLEYLFRALR